MTQLSLDDSGLARPYSGLRATPPKQLLKWVGNKHRFACEIVSHFPHQHGTYFEPFLGTGAVLATLGPSAAVAGDALEPLVGIWNALKSDPECLKAWYRDRWQHFTAGDAVQAYEEIKASYNRCPNPADLVFISRACYGGVVRFRRADGFISTPCGCHRPISPGSFAARVDAWHERTKHATFLYSDFEPIMAMAQRGDLVYCDPPYVDTQAILYGAQGFSIERLYRAIAGCKERGAYVAMSIDGKKKSGRHACGVLVPDGLFEREALVDCGRSMLRRFQMSGDTLEDEIVHDRLLLTW